MRASAHPRACAHARPRAIPLQLAPLLPAADTCSEQGGRRARARARSRLSLSLPSLPHAHAQDSKRRRGGRHILLVVLKVVAVLAALAVAWWIALMLYHQRQRQYPVVELFHSDTCDRSVRAPAPPRAHSPHSAHHA